MDEELRKYLDEKFQNIDEKFQQLRNDHNNRFDKITRIITVNQKNLDDISLKTNEHEDLFDSFCRQRKDNYLNIKLEPTID